ncbi:MAG TPA: aminotransferase class V-fold PLP-dependent enzyme [Sedimenticola sp.]|nr:aminotransferase class V-fold PLP-dependent enzyme [Sedimenticola sp.]
MAAEFPLDPSLIYLNHAAVAPWPRRTARAVERFARENMEQGATHYPRWLEVERRLRGQLARLINAPSPDDISLLKNTSEGLSVVAWGIDWRAGDNLVSFRQEFPSNRIVWESLAPLGVEVRLVDLDAGESPEAALLGRCDERTRLVSTSSVQYAAGLRIDLERIGAFCRERGILFCVDAIQSLGALPFDVQRVAADFVVADGHKWMLGAEGVALFYSRQALRQTLRLHQYGWHMVERPGAFDAPAWSPSPTGTRFECGSPNMLGIHGLSASLSLIEEVGVPEIEWRIIRATDRLIGLIQAHPGRVDLLSDPAPARRSGIITFRPRDADPDAVCRKLMNQGVICAARGGGIRFSPHFHTPLQQLDVAWERLLDCL